MGRLQHENPGHGGGWYSPGHLRLHPALLTDTYNAKGLIVIGDYIDANAAAVNYKDVLYPGDATYDGKIVGLPQKSCTHQLLYNKKLFADAGMKSPGELYWEKGADGWNWNAFAEMGQALTKDLDGDGKTDQYFFAGQGSTSIVTFIRGNGGELFNADYTACTLTQPAAVDAIQWMGDLVLKLKIQPPPEMQANELGINFDTGKMVTATGTTCDSVRSLRKGFELPFGWDFVVLPAGSAGFRCWGDTDQIVISSSSKNPNQAFDWMLYRSSKDAWEESYAAGIVLAYSDGPTRWSIFDSKAFTEPLAAIDVKMIAEGYKFTIPNPYTPRSPQTDPSSTPFYRRKSTTWCPARNRRAGGSRHVYATERNSKSA